MKNSLIFLFFISISAFLMNSINGYIEDNADYPTNEGSDTIIVNFEFGATSSWKNIYAIWMEDTTSGFLQNIFICQKLITGGITGTALPYWKTNKYPNSSSSEIDAVTSATIANTDFSVSAILKDSEIRKFDLILEVDRSFDPNDWFSDQPALLYSVSVNLDDSTSEYELIPIGWTPNESTQNVIPNTPFGKLQQEMKYITNHKDGTTFGAVDERSATRMVKKITGFKVKVNKESCIMCDFNTGWNIFSIPNQPAQAAMDTIFQPIIESSSLVKIQDELGNPLENVAVFGGWTNNIGDINPTEGYKIKVGFDDNIEICGSPVQYPFAIPLRNGWNIISFPQMQTVDAMEVVQQLINNGTLIKVQDEQGWAIENLGIYGGWQNLIGNFNPGEGYKVKVSTSDTLWIYDNYPKSVLKLAETVALNHFSLVYTGNGVDHMNFNLVSIPEGFFNAGDEVAVYDGVNCVGSITINDKHLEEGALSIPVSAADNLGMSGFFEGNEYKLRIWNTRIKQEMKIKTEHVQGPKVFTKHESVLLSLEKSVLTDVRDLFGSETTEVKYYPNPFNKEITIEFDLSKESEVEAIVLNQDGQRIRLISGSALLPEGVNRLTWNGSNDNNNKVSTGIYHLYLRVNENIFIEKVILNR